MRPADGQCRAVILYSLGIALLVSLFCNRFEPTMHYGIKHKTVHEGGNSSDSFYGCNHNDLLFPIEQSFRVLPPNRAAQADRVRQFGQKTNTAHS
jgi:hypothetical protein